MLSLFLERFALFYQVFSLLYQIIFGLVRIYRFLFLSMPLR